jgi:hypothetical protein
MKALTVGLVSIVAFLAVPALALDSPLSPREILACQASPRDIDTELRLPAIIGLIPVADEDGYATRCAQVKAEPDPDLRSIEMFCGNTQSPASGN